MLPARTALLFALVAVSVTAPQDSGGQDSGGGEPRSIATFRAAERERLERELDGAWSLLTFTTDQGDVDPRDVRGFATFHQGYMTLVLQGREDVPRFLRDPGPTYTIQAGAFRYRVSDVLTLQTASVLGFSNANGDQELEFEPSNAVREYELRLTEDELALTRDPGIGFTFRRMPPGEFPATASEAIERSRAAPPRPRGR